MDGDQNYACVRCGEANAFAVFSETYMTGTIDEPNVNTISICEACCLKVLADFLLYYAISRSLSSGIEGFAIPGPNLVTRISSALDLFTIAYWQSASQELQRRNAGM